MSGPSEEEDVGESAPCSGLVPSRSPSGSSVFDGHGRMVPRLHWVQWLRTSVRSSGMQETEFPQIFYDNSVSVSGSYSTKAMHAGPCGLMALSVGMCEIPELMQVSDGWDTWLLGHVLQATWPSGMVPTGGAEMLQAGRQTLFSWQHPPLLPHQPWVPTEPLSCFCYPLGHGDTVKLPEAPAA